MIRAIYMRLMRVFCWLGFCDGGWYQPCKRCGKPVEPNL